MEMDAKMHEELGNISPFKHHLAIRLALIEQFQRVRVSGSSLTLEIIKEKIDSLMSWVYETPKSLTYRVNTEITSFEEICETLRKKLEVTQTRIRTFDEIPEMIVIEARSSNDPITLEIHNAQEVIVDCACGAAVLRGAHVFGPGVLCMSHGVQEGDRVNVFADVSGKCRKGAKVYNEDNKKFLGHGIARKTRKNIFDAGAKLSGIAVSMMSTTSGLPQLGNDTVPKGHAVLQNMPSIICSRILEPQPGETILDMCAAPGNKTTHISALMKGTGVLVALEKNKSKILRLEQFCKNHFACKNVTIHCYDATKAVQDTIDYSGIIDENVPPPYPMESFDRVLLDGPCSGLGQRPQITNCTTEKQMASYVPLQRQLFTAAVKLVKVGGVVVYSTCTVTITENEGIVAWALKYFPCLKLSSTRERFEALGLAHEYPGVTSGYSLDDLSEEDAKQLLRFGPGCDTIGFFIARFVKTASYDFSKLNLNK